jgi:hypothetical protein
MLKGGGAPSWQTGATTTHTLFSAFACDSGLANQPPVFVSSPTSLDDAGLPTDVRCYVGEACEITLHARDFDIDSTGARSGNQTSDEVRIQLAAGVATYSTTDLKHINGSACQSRGAVSCILKIKSSGSNMYGNYIAEQSEVRCVVAVDLHDPNAGPAKYTCPSMPLCFKIHFVPVSSTHGLITEFGDPKAHLNISPLPYIEKELHISWKYLGAHRSAALGNVTIEDIQRDSSVPRTLPGLTFFYGSLEARVPISVLQGTLERDLLADGTLMRFRVAAATNSNWNANSQQGFFGPWSAWLKIYAPAQTLPTGLTYATSWRSNLLYVWVLQRMQNTSATSKMSIPQKSSSSCDEIFKKY